jgi:hypothetical protein
MQTSKISPGNTYAYKHRGELVRFLVEAIKTTRGRSGTSSQIEGRISEPGDATGKLVLDPSDLIGPYEQVAELAERKAKEDAARKVKEAEAEAKARAERLLLYKFVGVQAPKDAKAYDQPFKLDYGSTVDVRREGVKLLIERIEKLEQEKPALRIVPKESA